MTGPRIFNKEKFLLYLLGGIFVFQAAVFGAGLFFCARAGGLQTCPKIGERYENTFNVMIATTLALLTGSAVASVSQKKNSSSSSLPSDEQPRQLPRRRSQGKTSALQAQDQASEAQVEPQAQASSQASEKEKKQPPGKR